MIRANSPDRSVEEMARLRQEERPVGMPEGILDLDEFKRVDRITFDQLDDFMYYSSDRRCSLDSRFAKLFSRKRSDQFITAVAVANCCLTSNMTRLQEYISTVRSLLRRLKERKNGTYLRKAEELMEDMRKSKNMEEVRTCVKNGLTKITDPANAREIIKAMG